MLVYTFRSYPHLKELERIFPDVFVFGSLRDDIVLFRELIKDTGSNVLGIADSVGQSRIEPIAINKFNNGKLEMAGPDEVGLFLDPCLDALEIAKKPTSTFCNWTMYRIQRFIDEERLKCKLTFVHINANDLSKLSVLTSWP